MKKELISRLLIATLVLSLAGTTITPSVEAKAISNLQIEEPNISKININQVNEEIYDDISVASYEDMFGVSHGKVIDENVEYNISFDPMTNELTINGQTETIDIKSDKGLIDRGLMRSSEIYTTTSTAYIPWRETVAVTATAIQFITKIPLSVSRISAIIGSQIGFQNAMYYRYDQYKSREQYWSSYHGIYYNKIKNKNIRIYKNSVALSNSVLGPYNGSWFDPIRPY